LVDINPLDPGTPRVINPSICTAAVGLVSPCLSFPSGPTSVSVDYNQNIALVVNSTSKSVAVVDLNAQKVLSVTPIPFPAGGVADTPEAVGINPVTGQALVAMQTKNYGVLMDLTKSPPAFVGVVSISTGPNTRVAVEPNLNWALATPGGLGSLAIVDLSQKSTNTITAISRTTNVVTVTVDNSASAEPLSVQAGDAVQNLNVQFSAAAILANPALATLAPTFDGYFAVTQTGPAANQFSYTETGQTFPDVASASAQVSATGPIYYSQPVATVGLPLSDQGIGINPETQQAVLVDPTTGGVVSFFSLIDQSVSSLTLETNGAAESGTTAAAYNPLTNTVVAVNSFTNTVSVIDPTAPRRLNDGNLYQLNTQCPLKNCAVAVAIDPGTNIAVVANQSDNSVSVLNLGAIKPFSLTETSPKTVITTSTLLSGPSPSPQTLTVIGKGLTCVGGRTSLLVRLDGVALDNISCVGNGDRELTATVPSNLLMSARRFALDVADLSGKVTNAEDFTVEQSVDVSSASCHAPQPTGVAIDPQLGPQGLAAVTLFGCNSLALINMATGTGSTVVVGTNPIGVAVLPRLHIAVVANNGGSGTASIVNEVQQSVTQTVATGTSPVGAAADQSTGEVAIANSVANTVTVVNAVTGGTNSISTGQGPIAVGFNYVNHQLAVAASSGNSVGVSDGAASTQTQSFTVNGPTSVIYDPVPTDCGDNINGTTTNTVGCFIASSSTGNSVSVIDPISSAQVTFRIGINPTAIAYNYLTSTLVSTNTASHTVTIADFLAQKIRAVLPLPPTTNATNANLGLSLASLQYGLDIHPFTNIAVVADTVNGRVLFLPLPR
jgi:DNA-binding beta-propeller fold protein YncE